MYFGTISFNHVFQFSFVCLYPPFQHLPKFAFSSTTTQLPDFENSPWTGEYLEQMHSEVEKSQKICKHKNELIIKSLQTIKSMFEEGKSRYQKIMMIKTREYNFSYIILQWTDGWWTQTLLGHVRNSENQKFRLGRFRLSIWGGGNPKHPQTTNLLGRWQPSPRLHSFRQWNLHSQSFPNLCQTKLLTLSSSRLIIILLQVESQS